MTSSYARVDTDDVDRSKTKSPVKSYAKKDDSELMDKYEDFKRAKAACDADAVPFTHLVGVGDVRTLAFQMIVELQEHEAELKRLTQSNGCGLFFFLLGAVVTATVGTLLLAIPDVPDGPAVLVFFLLVAVFAFLFAFYCWDRRFYLHPRRARYARMRAELSSACEEMDDEEKGFISSVSSKR